MIARHARTDLAGREGSRRGFVLPVVLAVLVILTLAVYQLAERTTTQRSISRSLVERKKADLAARSAADIVLALAADPLFGPAVLDDGATFDLPDGTRVTLLRIATDGSGPQPGVASEAAKLNVNLLVDGFGIDGEQLAVFVGDTDAGTADLVVDMIDSDATPSALGDESGLSGMPLRNRPLDTLDDLLLVPGITAAQVYGEDANRNGLLDANEDDGDESPPLDNADGVLDFGWQRLLTTQLRESNVQPDGSPKVNLNADDLTEIQAGLEATGMFTAEQIEFILAARTDGLGSGVTGTGMQEIEGADGPGGGGTGGAGGAGGADGAAGGRSGGPSDDPADETAATPQFRLQTIGSLLNPLDSGGASPFADDYPSLGNLYLHAALSDVETLPGRLDLNAVDTDLLGRLLEDEALASTITQRRDRLSLVDLLIDGVMTPADFDGIERVATVSGQTFRFQAVGFRPNGPAVRYEFLIDAAQPTLPRIIEQRDLSELGLAIDRSVFDPDFVAE